VFTVDGIDVPRAGVGARASADETVALRTSRLDAHGCGPVEIDPVKDRGVEERKPVAGGWKIRAVCGGYGRIRSDRSLRERGVYVAGWLTRPGHRRDRATWHGLFRGALTPRRPSVVVRSMQTLPRSVFEDYVTARTPMLLRFAYLLCGDRHLAEDLVQEVLIKAHRRWSAIEAENPDAYLKQALLHTHLSWRRRRSSSEVATSTIRDAATLDAFDEAHASRADTWSLLATLSPRQRAVLVLRYFEDLDDRRIAELVGSTAAAVRVHAHRGLTTLRETLAQQADEAPSGAGMGETVRRGVAKAAARRRLVTVGGVAAVVAALALLTPLLRPPASGPPVGPSPSVTPSPTATSSLTLVPMILTPPVFPYRLAFIPPRVGPAYVTMAFGLPELNFGDRADDKQNPWENLSISIRSQKNVGDPGLATVTSHTTVSGHPATQWVSSNPTGGPYVELEWEQDGKWFYLATNGTVSVNDAKRVAEALRPGTTTSTRLGLAAQFASIALPPGYVVGTWQVDGVCAAPQGDYSVVGLCIRASTTDWTYDHEQNFTIDGDPAYVFQAGWGYGLVVHRPDGPFVQITPPGGEVSYSVEDLAAIYRGVTFS
jgi:RNA polymerase sigma-70 factor (sigma-E family)